jgi:hypothetical protein
LCNDVTQPGWQIVGRIGRAASSNDKDQGKTFDEVERRAYQAHDPILSFSQVISAPQNASLHRLLHGPPDVSRV